MSSSKLRKISKIVKEMSVVKSQKNYDISGLTISLCKFYYREPQKQFKDLPIGDYTIETSHNTQTLVINNATILDRAESIQVCYELDLTSSKYESDFEIDINRLASSYNEAVDDLHNLWSYIRNIGMVADDTTIDLILPQLDTNEVWVKTEDGYKGVPLDDVEQSVKEIIEKYSKEKIQEINIETEQHVNNVLKPMLDEYEENIEVQLDMYTNDKKLELDTHEQLKEQELNDLKEQLAKELDDLVKGAVADKGVMPNGTDWHTLTRGSYYVLDLFNSQFKNHPYQLANQNEERGIVIVTETEQGMSKVITYHSTSKRMFFTILVKSGIWSEWSVLGGGKGSVYEITQPNHGFNFNSISLGNDGLWELADPNVGADAVAIKIDNDRFQLLFNGQGIIPTSSRDDLGNPFIEDEYYFMSIDTPGGLRKEKPKQIIFQPLFHTRTVEGKLIADIQIGEVHDLTQHIVDSETIKEYGIATEKDLLNKLDKVNTIEELKSQNLKVGDIVELLGYYTAGDGANHKRVIANEDDGSGIQLANGLWANIIHNGEVNVSWFGAKGDGVTDDTQAIQKALNNMKNGYKFILQNGEYRISQIITKGVSNCEYIFLGNFKVLDNIKTPFGVFNIRGNSNCNFYGLKINGNSENVIDEKAYGISCSLLIGAEVKKCTFNNFYIENTIYCACCIGRNVTQCTFNNFIFNDIGEHCFYASGDNISNLCFDNIKATNIALNPFNENAKHECYIIKTTNIDAQRDIIIKNSSLTQNKSINVSCYIVLPVANNTTISYCSVFGKASAIVNSHNPNSLVIIDNCYTETNCVHVSGNDYPNIKIKNSIIHEMIYAEQVKYYKNCTFEKFLTTYLSEEKKEPTFIDNCKFILNSDKAINYKINSDIFFRNCEFVGKNIAQLDTAIIFSNSNNISDCNIIFINCNFYNLENYTTPFYLFSNLHNAFFANCRFEGHFLFKGKNIRINDTMWNEAYLLSQDSRNQIENLVYRSVIKNGVDFELKRNLNTAEIRQLGTVYMGEKMKQEGVYNDYITYIDKKTLYNKKQEKLEKEKQLAYEQALQENPNLSYEEFMSVQPMTLNLVEEPQPSQALQEFMKKYL